MPTNVTAEYLKAEEEYRKAKSVDEKIRALEKMIAECPKHKGTEDLLAHLRKKLAKLRKEKEGERRKRGKRPSFFVPKQGMFQIVIVGFPNVGKSTLLKKLTGANPKIADYPFTTVSPEVGILDVKGAKVQLVEVPPLVEGASEHQREYLALIKNADFIIMLIEDDGQREILEREMKLFGIDESKIRGALILRRGQTIDGEEVFKHFGLMKVYLKEPRKEPDYEEPLVVKKGTTLEDIAKKLDIEAKYARVWGSSKFPGQKVDLNFVVSDGDVVEFHS